MTGRSTTPPENSVERESTYSRLDSGGTRPQSELASDNELHFVIVPTLAILAVTQIVLARFFSGLDGSASHQIADVMPVIALLVLPAFILVAAIPVFRKRNATIVPVALIFAAGFLMRVCYFGSAPILETDHYRYLWDGALVAHGLNPYTYSPAAALSVSADAAVHELAGASRGLLERINFPELRSIYPGVAQLMFGLAHLLAPWEVDGIRLAILVAELATFGLLLTWLKELGRSQLLAALYWANPLVTFSFAGQAHVDALIPPLLLGALLLLRRGRLHVVAGSLIGAAAGVKLWPVLLVPLCVGVVWADRKKAAAFLFGVLIVSAISVGPLLLSTGQEGSGLVAYGTQWANNNALYAWTVTFIKQLGAASATAETVLRVLLAASVAATAVAVAFKYSKGSITLMGAALTVTAVLFYLSPAQFPWYAVWFLPFAAIAANGPLLLASVTLPSYFLFFPLALRDETWFFMHYVSLIHAVPVLLWLALACSRRYIR